MGIEPTYVTFEQAKHLKEKGFDVPTMKFYYLNDKRGWFKNGELGEGFDDEYWGNNTNLNWNRDGLLPFKPFSECMSAPEQWQIVEWLRVNHAIWIEVRRTSHFNEIRYQSYINEKYLSGDMGGYVSHTTPQEAYSAAFDYVLNNKLT